MEKQVCELREIPLAELSGNPKNPRKLFTGPKRDELMASIKEKGVIEPIIVRPKKLKNTNYKIVAGERRFLASEMLGLKTIPAIVRELTDDQAFEFMLIENLQREDLTEFEEAESFKLYVGKHGEEGIRELGQKTGISSRYIRRRLAVLGLPGYTIEAWKKGRLRYGHLEQLLRVKESPKLKELFRAAIAENTWRGQTTVEELRREIDNQSPSLSLAYFPLRGCEGGCETCPKNSAVQRELFGIEETKGVRCLDPACFKKKQNDWLLAHWKESPPGKKYGTNGFRFRDKVGYNDHESVRYHFKPDEKCKACPHFLTIIHETGEPAQGDEQECFNKPCLRARISKVRGEERTKEKTERKPGEPRATWHGEYFRDIFLSKRIPEALAKLDPAGPVARALLLASAIHGHYSELKSNEQYSGAILMKTPKEIDAAIAQTLQEIILSGQHVGASRYNGWGTKGRRIVAEYLGIDLAKGYAVDKDYLEKKTKGEIIAFGKKFKIFSDPKAKAYLQKKLKGRDVDKLKKGELVDLVLKSGVELVGKVPAEILKEQK